MANTDLIMGAQALGPILKFIRDYQNNPNAPVAQTAFNSPLKKYASNALLSQVSPYATAGLGPILSNVQYARDNDGNFFNNFSLGAPGPDERGREALIKGLGGALSAVTLNPIPALASAIATKLVGFEPGEGYYLGANPGTDTSGIGGFFNKLFGRIDPDEYEGIRGQRDSSERDDEKSDVSNAFIAPGSQSYGNIRRNKDGDKGTQREGPYGELFIRALNDMSDPRRNLAFTLNPGNSRTGGVMAGPVGVPWINRNLGGGGFGTSGIRRLLDPSVRRLF